MDVIFTFLSLIQTLEGKCSHLLLLDEGEERNTISSRVSFVDRVKLSMWEEPSKRRRTSDCQNHWDTWSLSLLLRANFQDLGSGPGIVTVPFRGHVVSDCHASQPGAVLLPRGHLTQSGVFLIVMTGGMLLHLMSGGLGCC